MPNSKFLTLEKKGYGKKALKCGHDFRNITSEGKKGNIRQVDVKYKTHG